MIERKKKLKIIQLSLLLLALLIIFFTYSSRDTNNQIFDSIRTSEKKNTPSDEIDNESNVFYNIEYNLRELGFGDVSVNKKMKDLNKILYDILLKIGEDFDNSQKLKINSLVLIKYFPKLKEVKNTTFDEFLKYFENFFDFCFELPSDNMLKELKTYRI